MSVYVLKFLFLHFIEAVFVTFVLGSNDRMSHSTGRADESEKWVCFKEFEMNDTLTVIKLDAVIDLETVSAYLWTMPAHTLHTEFW